MTFSLFYWNIYQSVDGENYKDTKWDRRAEEVLKIILDKDPDIICLVELRNLENSKYKLKKFIAMFPDDYEVNYRQYIHWTGNYYMGILVKNSKLLILDTKVISINTSPLLNNILMITQVQCIKTHKKFRIGLTHYPHNEKIKWNCISKTLKQFEYNTPLIVCGDFNFFDTREGVEHRNKMLEYCNDVAYPLYDENKKQLSGTFYGYKHDEYKLPFNKMERLDHIFIDKKSEIKIQDKAISPCINKYSFDNECYPDNLYPSDHLSIFIKFSI